MYIFDETDGSLAHYGVKGMKWGVRKERIKNARASVRSQKKAIRQAKKEGHVQRMSDLQKKLRNDPDRITAGYMTRGEQIVGTIVGSVLTSGIGLPGMLAGNYSFEKIQDSYGESEGFRNTSPHAQNKALKAKRKR